MAWGTFLTVLAQVAVAAGVAVIVAALVIAIRGEARKRTVAASSPRCVDCGTLAPRPGESVGDYRRRLRGDESAS